MSRSPRSRRSNAIVAAIAAVRLSLGLAALLAPARTARAAGYPEDQDTAAARLMGRFFGMREIVLGLLALGGHGGATPLACRRRPLGPREREFVTLNLVNDAVDAAAMTIPLLRHEGIARPMLTGIPTALAVSAGWLAVRLAGTRSGSR